MIEHLTIFTGEALIYDLQICEMLNTINYIKTTILYMVYDDYSRFFVVL
jgi:hypothetical protein